MEGEHLRKQIGHTWNDAARRAPGLTSRLNMIWAFGSDLGVDWSFAKSKNFHSRRISQSGIALLT